MTVTPWLVKFLTDFYFLSESISTIFNRDLYYSKWQADQKEMQETDYMEEYQSRER